VARRVVERAYRTLEFLFFSYLLQSQNKKMNSGARVGSSGSTFFIVML
jgi:hypothetical protein